MTRQGIVNLVKAIEYKDWIFDLDLPNIPKSLYERSMFVEEPVFLQIRFRAPDNFFPEKMVRQIGRVWVLDTEMSESEVVKTVWMAVWAAEEHEAREKFLFHGHRVFSPHQEVK